MRMEIGLLTVLLIGFLIISQLIQPQVPPGSELKKFSSYDELENFVKTNVESYGGYLVGAPMVESIQRTTVGEAVPSATGAEDYSTTNIQVAGVDEADIVKNDGKYIYVVSGNNIVILDAYPAEEAKILSEIELDGSPQEIFINKDKLVVFGYGSYATPSVGIPEVGIAPRYYTSKTFINVYDVSDREDPVLTRNVSMEGNYFDSRMIGDYVYVITNRPVYYSHPEPIPLPIIYDGTQVRKIAASEIYYFDVPDTSYIFTNILAINTQNDDEELSIKTFLMGYSQNMYVSPTNIYIVYTKRVSMSHFYDRIIDEAIMPFVPLDTQNKIRNIRSSNISNYEKMQEIGKLFTEYVESLDPETAANLMKIVEEKMLKVQTDIAKETEKTVIHKISVNNENIEYVTNGEAPGHVLNQFSMDEYEGYFRIATTTGGWRAETANHLYVLDNDLKIVGKVEDLAPGERIYSTRFIRDKGYMVTFRQIDPLFVIDLSDPNNPEVLGYLKIPGVSDYLHPYDETHIIGVGRDATEEGRMLGMKLSLFDITDVSNPTEISKYIIGERGTTSDALYDHKAFLFDKSKNLLVIPVSVSEGGKWNAWQGAYVFNLDLDDGFELKGRITHANETSEEDEYYDYQSQVKRSLYIDDVLYTISIKMIKMNDLDDLDEINQIELPYEQEVYPRPL